MKKFTCLLISCLMLFTMTVIMGVSADAECVKTPFETFDSPQYETLTGSPTPGKWTAYSINYGGSMDMTAANFPTATKTPSGDNKSLLANMGWPDAPSDLIRTNPSSAQIDFVNDDGFYITLNSDKAADLIFRFPDFLWGNAFYTILEVSAGWKTYFIPFESFMQENGENGFNKSGAITLPAFVLSQAGETFNTTFRIRHKTSASTTDARINFKGETITRALNNSAPVITIDEMGYYAGTAPAGNVENAPIPVAYTALESFSSPLWDASWDNPNQALFAGKWQAFSVTGLGAGGIGASNFSATTLTPSGDTHSMVANMTNNQSIVRKTFAVGTKYDITADGLYITLNSDKAGYMILRTYLNATEGALPGDRTFFTMLKVEEGWKTYFIPYVNIICEEGTSGKRNSSLDNANWTMNSTLTTKIASTEFKAVALAYQDDLATAGTRIDFKGNVTTAALPDLGGSSIVIDEFGYFSGDMPAGQVKTHTDLGGTTSGTNSGSSTGEGIPLVHKSIDNLSNPQLGGAWSGTLEPGKWQAYNLDGNGSTSISSANFADNKLVADLSAHEAAIRKSNAISTLFDTGADGFYLTFSADKESDLIFRVKLNPKSGGATFFDGYFYTIIAAKKGLNTYYIPYKNLVEEDSVKGTDGVFASTGWNLGNTEHFLLADTLFTAFMIEHAASTNTSNDRTTFTGNKYKGSLTAVGPTIILEDIGYFSGSMPAGQIKSLSSEGSPNTGHSNLPIVAALVAFGVSLLAVLAKRKEKSF